MAEASRRLSGRATSCLMACCGPASRAASTAMTSAAGSQAQPTKKGPSPAPPTAGRSLPSGVLAASLISPVSPAPAAMDSAGRRELDVPYVVDGLDERRRDQQDRRHHQPGQRRSPPG